MKLQAIAALLLGLVLAATLSFGPLVLLVDPSASWIIKVLAAATCAMAIGTIVLFANVAWHLWERDND